MYLSNTLSLSVINSTLTRTHFEHVFYEHAAIVYTTLLDSYSPFLLVFTRNDDAAGSAISKPALIGIICGAVLAAFIVIGLITFLVMNRNGKEENKSESFVKDLNLEETPEENMQAMEFLPI